MNDSSVNTVPRHKQVFAYITSDSTMLLLGLLSLLLIRAASSTIDINPVVLPLLHLFGLRPANNCGPCPPRDCRLVPAIFLGYCCGCALPIDRVPILCPTSLICPPLSPRLCGDYNYLMECCC
ncbi:hypothetical protein J6590_093423 [Homalodisca vitripennis]|nr:hypothetical protein J6590_105489 [Homalodisca vitripennis]KAG8299744.1 hypothetical protein J6590_093423 [Homalodisca vitripennis]